MKRVATIVAAGPRSPQSKAYSVVEARLMGESRRRHAEQLKGDSVLGRILLEWRIWREVQAELKKIFPPNALYATGSRKSRA